MSEHGANVEFGGDASGAVEAAKKAAEAVKGSVESMQKAMETLTGVFEMAGTAFAGFAAIVAGGSALKEFVADAVKTDMAAMDLGRSLGISSAEASVFAVALNGVGVSQDTVALAGKRITMELVQNEAKFKALGVATRSAGGEFRNAKDIMLDVNDKLRGFKEGTDRNIEAMKVYGRSYQELMPLIERFTDISLDSARKRGISDEDAQKQQDEARETAESLNLVVGDESVAAAMRYSQAKREMGDVMEGVSRTIGEALLPSLTAMAEWFSSVGPTAVTASRVAIQFFVDLMQTLSSEVMELLDAVGSVFADIGNIISETFGDSSEPMTGMKFFANVLTVVKVAVMAFSLGIQSSFNLVVGAFRVLLVTASAALRQLNALLTLDFKGFAAAGKQWQDDVTRIIQETVDKGAAIANAGGARIQAALLGDATVKKKETSKDQSDAPGKHTTGMAKSDGSAGVADAAAQATLAKKKEQLAEEMKAAEFAHQQELLSDAEFYAKKLAIAQAGADAEIDAKRGQIAALSKEKVDPSDETKVNALKADRIKLEGELSVAMMKRAALASEISNEEIKAEEDYAKKAETEAIENQKKLAEIEIDAKAEAIKSKAQLAQIDKAQEMAAERELIDERYQAEKQALDALLELAKNNQQERAKLLDQMVQLDKQHDNEMVKNADQTTADIRTKWAGVVGSMTQGLGGAIKGMIQHTTTFHSMMQGLMNNTLSMFTDWVAKLIQQWLTKEAMQTAATVLGTGERTAAESAGALESVAINAWAAIKNIANLAWQAMAGAFNAMVSIPYVGPALAVGAGALAFGAVARIAGSISSARNGFDIPAGVNPVTQLHEREMVLPAKQADAVRQMADGGGSGGGPNIHFHGEGGDFIHKNNLAKMAKALNGKFAFK